MIWNEIKGFFGGLAAPVGDGRESRPEDVVRVRPGMRALGRYPRAAAEPTAAILRRGRGGALTLERAIWGEPR